MLQEVNVHFEVRPIQEDNHPTIRRLLQQVLHHIPPFLNCSPAYTNRCPVYIISHPVYVDQPLNK